MYYVLYGIVFAASNVTVDATVMLAKSIRNNRRYDRRQRRIAAQSQLNYAPLFAG